jgi:hypothetical protein
MALPILIMPPVLLVGMLALILRLPLTLGWSSTTTQHRTSTRLLLPPRHPRTKIKMGLGSAVLPSSPSCTTEFYQINLAYPGLEEVRGRCALSRTPLATQLGRRYVCLNGCVLTAHPCFFFFKPSLLRLAPSTVALDIDGVTAARLAGRLPSAQLPGASRV